MNKSLTFFVAIFLLGCITSNNSTESISVPKSSDWIGQHGQVKEDALHSTKTITFPPLSAQHLPNYQDVTGMSATQAPIAPYGIAVIQKPHMPDMYVVYINETSGSLEEARAENGNKLLIIPMDSLVNTANTSATISENLGIQISLAFLEKNRHRNPQIKIFGKQESFIIFLPDYYIDTVLKYIHQH